MVNQGGDIERYRAKPGLAQLSLALSHEFDNAVRSRRDIVPDAQQRRGHLRQLRDRPVRRRATPEYGSLQVGKLSSRSWTRADSFAYPLGLSSPWAESGAGYGVFRKRCASPPGLRDPDSASSASRRPTRRPTSASRSTRVAAGGPPRPEAVRDLHPVLEREEPGRDYLPGQQRRPPEFVLQGRVLRSAGQHQRPGLLARVRRSVRERTDPAGQLLDEREVEVSPTA